jgi:hypothetical protein
VNNRARLKEEKALPNEEVTEAMKQAKALGNFNSLGQI